MKISSGIRLGSRGKTQIKGAWLDSKGGVCAIGALMKLPDATGDVCTDFPALDTPIIGSTHYNPAYGNYPLINFIIDRNERGESFEQIIKWLESIGQ